MAARASREQADQLRGFLELAPDDFGEFERAAEVERAAYGEAAGSVLAAFPDVALSETADDWHERRSSLRSVRRSVLSWSACGAGGRGTARP